MKVLLTGATGFIGRQCSSQLKAQGYEVHAISSAYHPCDDEIYWHKVDLLDRNQSRALVRDLKPTHLLHLAWYTEPRKYWTAVENFYWVQASLILIEEFVASGGKRIVVAGSCAEYDWSCKSFKEEGTPLVPSTIYGTCKHALQLMLNSYAVENNISVAWGRVFSIYGPHEDSKRLVPSVIIGILNSCKVNCVNGNLVRDYLHVADVASAFLALLESDIEGPVNIGSGRGLRLRYIVEKIETRIGKFGHLTVTESKSNYRGPAILIADIKRLKLTGWRPTYDIESGIGDTIKWFKKS